MAFPVMHRVMLKPLPLDHQVAPDLAAAHFPHVKFSIYHQVSLQILFSITHKASSYQESPKVNEKWD